MVKMESFRASRKRRHSIRRRQCRCFRRRYGQGDHEGAVYTERAPDRTLPLVLSKQVDREPQKCVQKVEKTFPYPVFVKPANLGSSVGISKAHNRQELEEAFQDASRYDLRIVIEKGINAREIECSVLGNEEPQASLPGEIVPKREFYDYVAKYIEDSTELHVPARMDPAQIQRVQELSIRAFQAVGCSGMGRVDLLLDRDTGIFYVNEINTIPGFTSISMYPKLWEVSGLPFDQLLERLLELGLQRFQDQAKNVMSFDLIQNP